ncbi:MAG: pitrilysin family protein [Fibrobacter sp.]|nr:pitrilysin family protein [Fibrobacter sp.]
MKNTIFYPILFILLATFCGFSKSKTVPIVDHPSQLKFKKLDWKVPEGKPYRIELKNGAVLYIAQDSLLPLVQITGYVNYGSLLDPEGKEGISSLLTNLMRTGGTQKYPSDTLNELIDLMAIKVGLSTSLSQLTFSASFLSEYTEQALDIIQQILFFPVFEQEKVDKEKKITLESIRHRFNEPAPILEAAYVKSMYRGQIHGRLTSEKSVNAISRDDLLKLHKRVFTQSNMIISVSGMFNRDSMTARIDKLLNADMKKHVKAEFPSVKLSSPDKCLIVHKPLTQAYVRLGLPLFKRPHEDYYAMSVLNVILGGGGFTSRLGAKIRSNEGLTYSIYSHAESNYTFDGTFFISFFTANASFAKAIDLTLKEVREVVANGVTDKEIAHAKASLAGDLPSMFRSSFDIVSTYAWNEYYGRSENHYKEYEKKINDVSKKDLVRVAEKYLDMNNIIYTVVGDTSVLLKQESGDFSLKKLKVKIVDTDSLSLLP